MLPSWLIRFGAVCGVLLGLSIAVPGGVEAFTGESSATSFVIGFGAALGGPAVTALYLRQSAVAGRFGAVAYAVNLVGLALFAGVAFALNLVVFYLDEATVTALLDGPTGVAVLGSAGVFVVGTILFGVSMLRAGVFPRYAAVGYAVLFTVLALLAPLPDTLWSSVVHVLAGAALIRLSAVLWTPVRTAAGLPVRVAATG